MRTPLILDALWACLPETGEDVRARLVRLFEEDAPKALAPPRPAVTLAPAHPAPPVEPPAPPAPRRSHPVLEKILGALNHEALRAIAAREGIELEKKRGRIAAVRQRLLDADVKLPTVLGALTRNQLALACRALGVSDEGEPAALIVNIVEANARR